MSLHRADKVADWEKIPPEEWNQWQKRAAETRGWDTPGNRETAKGAAASFLGLWLIDKDKPVLGTIALGWGRWRDIKDGQKAEATGTKSPTGEALDATVDRGLMAKAVPVLHRKGIITDSERQMMNALGAVNAGATLTAKYITHREIHPSRLGKYSAFVMWGALGTLCTAHALEQHNWLPAIQTRLAELGHNSLTAGLVAAGVASTGYVHDALAGEHVDQPISNPAY